VKAYLYRSGLQGFKGCKAKGMKVGRPTGLCPCFEWIDCKKNNQKLDSPERDTCDKGNWACAEGAVVNKAGLIQVGSRSTHRLTDLTRECEKEEPKTRRKEANLPHELIVMH
jgi:hypothetical protein